jgi:hypothetical protein
MLRENRAGYVSESRVGPDRIGGRHGAGWGWRTLGYHQRAHGQQNLQYPQEQGQVLQDHRCNRRGREVLRFPMF